MSIVLGVLYFLSCSPVVFAADHVVTPLARNYELEKREIVSDVITVTNTSPRVLRVYASVNTVAMDGGVVESFVSQSAADQSITPTSWIEISRQRIEIPAGESLEVPYTIRMNPLTKPGDYSVFIGVAQASNKTMAKQMVAQGKSPGTLLHISVDQTQNQFLRLEKFSVDKFVTESDGETMSFVLNNPGGVAVVPEGEIIFYDNNGNEVEALRINQDLKPVPANDDATYSMDVPEALSLGKYKAFLSVEYGEHLTASVHDTAFFYVMPLKQVILIFISVLILAIVIALLVHRRYSGSENDTDGAEYVSLYVRDGKSEDQHHDIDLSASKKDET